MPTSNIEFFATKNDLVPGLERVEQDLQPIFVAIGQFQSPSIPIQLSLRQNEQLGVSLYGNAPLEKAYWICKRNTKVLVQESPQRKGPPLYSADMGDRPIAVAIRLGGVFGDKCLIAGQLGSGCADDESRSFFEALSDRLFESFSEIGAYSVGPEARHLLGSGWRLTYAYAAPEKYDLRAQ